VSTRERGERGAFDDIYSNKRHADRKTAVIELSLAV
jgi:hypothetical protein